MLAMIQFGAAGVFRATESSTDIDIDAVLAYGEKRTKEAQAQLDELCGRGEDVRVYPCVYVCARE